MQLEMMIASSKSTGATEISVIAPLHRCILPGGSSVFRTLRALGGTSYSSVMVGGEDCFCLGKEADDLPSCSPRGGRLGGPPPQFFRLLQSEMIDLVFMENEWDEGSVSYN